MAEPPRLRLIAEESADLEVISAALQDSVTRVGDIRYLKGKRRVEIALNRFRWENEGKGGRTRHERARCVLAVDGVLGVKVRGLPMGESETIVSLLAVSFRADAEPPGGEVRLVFAGDGEIALGVECLDVTLADLGPVWSTRHRPDHERKG